MTGEADLICGWGSAGKNPTRACFLRTEGGTEPRKAKSNAYTRTSPGRWLCLLHPLPAA